MPSTESPTAGPLRLHRTSDLGHRRAPPPGTYPGAMVLAVGAPQPTMRAIVYGSDGIEEHELQSLDELRAVQRDAAGRTLWLDVECFGDQALLDGIAQAFEIHPLAMADVVNVPQRPKAELYGDRLLIVAQMVRLVEDSVDCEQVSLLLGPGWVVTFQEHPGDVFDPVRARIRSASSRIRQMKADFLAYALLDAVVDGFLPVVEAIGDRIAEFEEEVVGDRLGATLPRIHAVRRLLLTLHRIQWRQRDAIGAILRSDEFPFCDAVRVFLRDAYDHAFESVDAMEHYRDVVVGLMELYMSSASTRLNEVMKTLTIVSTIFIPLTFIVGVYGMNFDHMPELRWWWGYPAVWGTMLTIAAILMLWFRARGWIGSQKR